MRLLVLGCGTSTGVPVIGCTCTVCRSGNPRNRRTRSSALVRTRGSSILIDTSTDLRHQAITQGLTRIDSVLFTHPHADHIHGIDELRSFNMIQHRPIDCYADAATTARIRLIFEYIFSGEETESITPRLSLHVVDGPFMAGPVEVLPLELHHGRAAVLGFRMGGLAYLTDCSTVPPPAMERLRGLDVLVLGALRFRSHPTHMSIPEALELAATLGPRRTILTHLSHEVDYERDNANLPEDVELAYDGMIVSDIGEGL